ncbi:MAG: hypothetical protein ABI232_04495 [Jatrophihabitantaceae bacterium]
MTDAEDVDQPGVPPEPVVPTRSARRADEAAARRRRRRLRLARAMFVGSLVVAVAMATVLVVLHPWARDSSHRADAAPTVSAAPVDPGPALFTDPDTAGAVLMAASVGVAAVDSYDFAQLDQSLTDGMAVSTGDFLTKYRASMEGVVRSSAVAGKVIQTCTVLAVGLRSIAPDRSQADLLVFGTVSVTQAQGTTRSAPQTSPVSLQVRMTRANATWLISAMVDVSSTQLPALAPPGGTALNQATTAGVREVVNLLSYRRSDFDGDFQRALNGLTTDLAQQQQASKGSIQNVMTNGGFDLVGTVGAAAVSAAGDDSVTLIVLSHSTRVDDRGMATMISSTRYQVALTRTGGKWLVSQFTALDQS